ncbi:MAG: hypothetical protein Q9190_007127 [Brigantiaea leucoxantha]
MDNELPSNYLKRSHSKLYEGLEVDPNFYGPQAIHPDHGIEAMPVERQDEGHGPQLKMGGEEKEAIQVETTPESPKSSPSLQSKSYGRRQKRLRLAVMALAAVLIALAVAIGLGVGLQRRSNGSKYVLPPFLLVEDFLTAAERDQSHVFYIDNSNTLQEVISNDNLSSWHIGPLGQSDFKAINRSKVAFTVMYNDKWYGHDVGNSAGLRLWYGGDDDLVHELSYAIGDKSWSTGFTFPNLNASSGIASTGEGTGITHLWTAGNDGIGLWWKEFNTDGSNSSAHPLGIWVQDETNKSTPVSPSSSLGMSNHIFFQSPTEAINGLQVNPNAEKTEFGDVFPVGSSPGIPGTSLAVTTFFPTDVATSQLHVFFQTNGSDVMEFIRGRDGGQWSSNVLPVWLND